MAFGMNSSLGQTVFLNQPYDIGIVDRKGGNYLDIPIKNTSDKKVFIFRAEVDKRFQIHYSSKTILPDSTVYMRVQFTPEVKGPVLEEIKVHFSAYTEPKSIRIQGFAEEVPKSTIPCPHFSNQSINTSLNFELEVEVIDKETGYPINDAEVNLIQNGVVVEKLVTPKNGKVRKEVELGLYYFVASAETYLPAEFPKYINRNNDYVLIELEKDPNAEPNLDTIEEPLLVVEEQPKEELVEETVPVEEEMEFEDEVELVIGQPEEEPEIEVEEETVAEEVAEEPEIVEEEVVEPDPEPEYVEKYPDFPLSEYKPNNVVFVVDVSQSMKYTGKLDLLKASMIELSKMLRDIDKITIVSFSLDAHVILQTMSGDNKHEIEEKIKNLEAGGFTAGDVGLKKAYDMAKLAFIEDGNNQIIMATDGALNRNSTDINKMAAKYNKKGVQVSVVGIKNQDYDVELMQYLADQGGGRYVHIQTYKEAKSGLVHEIQKASQRSDH